MPYCWVATFDGWIETTLDALTASLDVLFPGHFLPKRDGGSLIISGAISEEFVVFSKVPGHDGVFLLYACQDAAASAAEGDGDFEPELRRYALSVASIGGDDEAALRFIGTVLAHLTPSDAAFLVDVETGEIVRFDDEVRAHMPRESPFARPP